MHSSLRMYVRTYVSAVPCFLATAQTEKKVGMENTGGELHLDMPLKPRLAPLSKAPAALPLLTPTCKVASNGLPSRVARRSGSALAVRRALED